MIAHSRQFRYVRIVEPFDGLVHVNALLGHVPACHPHIHPLQLVIVTISAYYLIIIILRSRSDAMNRTSGFIHFDEIPLKTESIILFVFSFILLLLLPVECGDKFGDVYGRRELKT